MPDTFIKGVSVSRYIYINVQYLYKIHFFPLIYKIIITLFLFSILSHTIFISASQYLYKIHFFHPYQCLNMMHHKNIMVQESMPLPC